MHSTMKENYPFIYSAAIKWGEMDALGHLNNTVYFKFSEEARIHLLLELGISVSMSMKMGPMLAYIDCQFKAPVVFPDSLIVGTWIEDIGHSSMHIMHHYYSQVKGDLVAKTKSVVVYVDYEKGAKIMVPEKVRTMIRAHQKNFDLARLAGN